MKMTKDQQQGKKEINYWLLSNEPEHILSGIGGAGKSWLVDLIIAELNILRRKGKILNINTITSAEVTATTNKAAGVLDNAVTIQKLLKLRMSYDVKTGKKFMVRSRSSQVLCNTLLVIDEASMVSANLLKQIRSLTLDCKILFVGDHCQLLPINESCSAVFDADINRTDLREPVRCTIPDVFKLCTQLRTTVETGIFHPIEASDNVKFVSGQLGEDTVKALFHADLQPDEAKIITYTNRNAIQYDKYIKTYLGKLNGWQVGDLALVNNSVLYSKTARTNIGSSHIIKDISAPLMYENIEYRQFTFDHFVLKAPTNWIAYTYLLKALRNKGDWGNVFRLEETFADLRDAYASTGHSAQGSSYGAVFINLTELCKCDNADTFARLLYVAVSRAVYKVYFTGSLSAKYGG